MTLGEIKNKALILLDETSKTELGRQYLTRMNSFLDTAQKQLALISPILRSAVTTATDGEIKKTTEMREITKIKSIDKKQNLAVIPFGESLLVKQDGQYLLEYAAYPRTIDNQSSDDDLLEITPEAQEAAHFFLAAMCVTDDEPQMYTLLMSLYAERASNLNKRMKTVLTVKEGPSRDV